MNAVARVGFDLAKDVFHVYAVDRDDRLVFSRNVTRRQLRELLATMPPCMVATESCGTAHTGHAMHGGSDTKCVSWLRTM
jgi:transposase